MEKLFKAIFNISSDGIVVHKNGLIIEANNAFVELFGYTSVNDVIGCKYNEMRTSRNDRMILQKSSPEGEFEYETEVINKDNTKTIIEVKTRLFSNNDNYKVVFFRDVTNTKIIEKEFLKTRIYAKELEKSNRKLKLIINQIENLNNELQNYIKKIRKDQNQIIHTEKMSSILSLSSGLAHEINNPLNYISGGIAGLEKTCNKIVSYVFKYRSIIDSIENHENIKVDLPTKDFLETISTYKIMFESIHEGIKRTKFILSSLLAFSNCNDNTFENVNVSSILDICINTLSNEYDNRIIVNKMIENNVTVFAIPAKFQQILFNILRNAFQAIPDRGIVTIKTHLNKESNIFSISIIDNGKGIPNHLIKQIFDPFFTTKDIGKGVGLGLYISYIYTEQHGGKIIVNSIENQGSEFRVELPFTQQ